MQIPGSPTNLLPNPSGQGSGNPMPSEAHQLMALATMHSQGAFGPASFDDKWEGSPDVATHIANAAQKYGFEPSTLKAFADIESSGNPSANRVGSQYKGLFQIGKDEWSNYGEGGDPYSARDNADAAGHMLADHRDWFQQRFGHDPSDAELYMMHQQGRGFFTKGAITNVSGNRYPGMRGEQTPATFIAGWGREIEKRKMQFKGDTGV